MHRRAGLLAVIAMFVFFIAGFLFFPQIISPEPTKDAVVIALSDGKVKELVSGMDSYKARYISQITGTDSVCDTHFCASVVINTDGSIPAYYVVVDMNDRKVIRIQNARGETQR